MKNLLFLTLAFAATLAIAVPEINSQPANDESAEGQPKVILVKSSTPPKKLTNKPQHKTHAKKKHKKSHIKKSKTKHKKVKSQQEK